MDKISAIYRILNTANGKYYYGSSSNVYERFYRHKLHLNKKKHDNSYLQNAWSKYGSNAFVFEIVEECPKTNLRNREQFYIDTMKSTNRSVGYNIAPFANRPPMTEETKRKIGQANKGKITWIKGKHHSKQTKHKISESNKKNNYMKNRTGDLHHFYGKKHSEESKAKMSAAKIGKFNNCSSKPVLQLFEDKEISQFPSLNEASRKTGIDAKNISACLNGKRKRAGGYSWDYAT